MAFSNPLWEMVASTGPFVAGKGLYTPAEAAFYARLHLNTLNRWLFGNNMGQPVIRPEAESSGERIVTFLDFVQALAIRAIRLEHRIHLDKIRSAVQFAEIQYGISHPLARRHTTYLSGREIQIVPEGRDRMLQASGRAAGQFQFRPILEAYMQDVGFDAEILAQRYTAFRYKDREVVMDPHIRFGEPLLAGCGYTPQALSDAATAEGSVEGAAKAFGVELDDVLAATQYIDHLGGIAA